MKVKRPPPLPARLWPMVLIGILSAFCLPARADLWVTGYYPGWEQSGMPASNIDFTVVTLVIHAVLTVNPDGSLDATGNGVTVANSADLVSRAHAAGRPVLISVGGAATSAGSEPGFLGATSSTNLPGFINNLTNFMASRGYDGVDIDWEPFYASDIPQFTNFVNALRAALNTFPPAKLLTAAVGAYPPYGDSPTAQYAMFAAIQNQFNQLNIMTYDLAGPWPGWVTWFNSPIFDGGYHFPPSGPLVPSVDGAVGNYLSNGVAPDKLGIGMAFYGDVWTGGSGVWQPRQSWPTTNVPTASQQSYQAIMSGYYQSNLYHWDTNAQAAYLGITNVVPTNDLFISYDDQHTCQAKISYARNQRLGGVMIWELAQDYFVTLPAGQRQPLLQSIKQGLATPAFTDIQLGSQQVTLGFAGLPLGAYRVQWTSNLPADNWNTLVVTNTPATGSALLVTDPVTRDEPQRFYRVETPP
ncbi:MAG TPA: glycoside hydrolase family 18 protein [Verrucomicrobiae bacterium]|nr:glycoside hydrolase family 18 protein [Verrucomicrobiae bacterium]